jgi:FtsH-binding integral membrane protein
MSTIENPPVYNAQEIERREEIQRGFITRVYGWMTIGLLITAAAALLTISIPGLKAAIVSSPFVFFGLLIGELAVVFALSLAANRVSPLVAGILFTGYAVLNGVTLSILFLVYTQSSIALTFGVTACTFGILTLFGYTTHRDLTRLGSLLIMGLIGLILASLVNLFLNNSAVYWITTYIGILIFVGLVAYDTQRLKNMSLALDEDGRQTQNTSIVGALVLYLDFINLFLLLLRVLGQRRS